MILSTGTHASNAEDVFLANVSELGGIPGTGDAVAHADCVVALAVAVDD